MLPCFLKRSLLHNITHTEIQRLKSQATTKQALPSIPFASRSCALISLFVCKLPFRLWKPFIYLITTSNRSNNNPLKNSLRYCCYARLRLAVSGLSLHWNLPFEIKINAYLTKTQQTNSYNWGKTSEPPLDVFVYFLYSESRMASPSIGVLSAASPDAIRYYWHHFLVLPAYAVPFN